MYELVHPVVAVSEPPKPGTAESVDSAPTMVSDRHARTTGAQRFGSAVSFGKAPLWLGRKLPSRLCRLTPIPPLARMQSTTPATVQPSRVRSSRSRLGSTGRPWHCNGHPGPKSLANGDRSRNVGTVAGPGHSPWAPGPNHRACAGDAVRDLAGYRTGGARPVPTTRSRRSRGPRPGTPARLAT